MSPGNEEGRPRQGGPLSSTATKSDLRIAAAADHVAHFRARVLAQALLDGWSVHNERQARRWEAARPRAGDYLGRSTVERERERWHRMTAVATAYRNRAEIAPIEELGVDLLNVLRESRGVAA